MSDILATFDGVWTAGNRDINGEGCPIGPDGWRFRISAFYNPGEVRRFGSDTFGSDEFGDYAELPPTVETWVDWTKFVSGCRLNRGVREPNVNQQTDEINFQLYDPDGSIVRWLGPSSLSSPNIGTPIRVELFPPDYPKTPSINIVTARINKIQERHGSNPREIDVICLGTKTELRTNLLPELRPAESIAERIDYVRAAIALPDPFEPYPAVFFTEELARDPAVRQGVDTEAYEIIQESAFSAGYMLFTTRDGSIGWTFIGDALPQPVSATISDCTGNGEAAVSTSQFWEANDAAILNVVQVWASNPLNSAEAIDASSVARFGRRSRGFGFPIKVANKSKTDAQVIADSILSRAARRVNRVSDIEFHTLTDPRWFDLLYIADIGTVWDVQRSRPEAGTITASIIGYDLAVTSSHIEGAFYTSTPYATP